ncbi:MAG: hypothetical protein KGI71_04610, partial [Patescibacteria group bacterium]|nr:hypothetical protein [Patescibacteria group bacterium]
KQGGVCELGKGCLVGGPLPRPSEWLKLPLRERRARPREGPTLDHIEGYRDPLHVRGLCHHACNRVVHAAYFRWLHTKATLEKAGLPVPPFEPVMGQAGERKESVPASLPLPPSPSELAKMLGPGFRVVPNDGDSYSNKLHDQCAPVARRLWLTAVRNGTLSGMPRETKEKFGVFTRKRLVAWIAEKVGEEVITIDRYAERYMSDAGPCEPDDTGKRATGVPNGVDGVFFRDPAFYYLGVDELLELFPEEGQRAVNPARRETLLTKAQADWKEAETKQIQARFGELGK